MFYLCYFLFALSPINTEINKNLFADKILFESNQLSDQNEVQKIIDKFIENGYNLEHRAQDTILVKIKEST